MEDQQCQNNFVDFRTIDAIIGIPMPGFLIAVKMWYYLENV